MELLNQELLEQDKGTQELLRQVLEGTKIFHFYYYPQKRLEVMPVRTSKYFNCSMEYRNIPESFVEDFVSGEVRQIAMRCTKLFIMGLKLHLPHSVTRTSSAGCG